MKRKVRNIIILILVSILLFTICLFNKPAKGNYIAGFSMLDIGQGDSFLIEAPNGTKLLIDGGRDSKVLIELAKVMPSRDKYIDAIIATHPDADHIGGLVAILKHYDVGLFLTSDVLTDTATFKDLFAELDKRNIPSYYARAGMDLLLDTNADLPEKFSIIFPDRPTTNWETNNASVVGRLQIGDRSALFTGDSPSNIESYLIKKYPKDIDVDILKLGHHGSKYSSSIEYLKAVSPSLALVSAGINNRYGHPAPEVLNRLKSLNIPYVSTQDSSTVTFTSDGLKWFRK